MDIQSQILSAQRKNGRARQSDRQKNEASVATVTKKTSEISLEEGAKVKPQLRGQRRTAPVGSSRADRSNAKDPDFDRGGHTRQAKTLFDPRRDPAVRGPATQNSSTPPASKPDKRRSRQPTAQPSKPLIQDRQPRIAEDIGPGQDPEIAEPEPIDKQDDIKSEEEVRPFKQLDVPQIQPDQLIREAKSIYAAMLMVENKCNEVDRQEDAKVRAGDIQHIPATRYKELVVLHRTLLYEQYDFFLACSHPAATPQLKLLPHKYGMPGRIWKSGIHTFLEVLRHHLPESLEHMLTFLHMAYGVVCLLYETIPSHKATWIECLGDLARYRMAVEERDAEIRDIWTDRAREWYYAATDIFPTVGRLYHHLAIVARQNAIEQLYLYVKSLTVDLIFTGTRESVLILFQTVSKETPNGGLITNVDYLFVQLHQMLFTKVDLDAAPAKMGYFLSLLRKALEISADPETPEYWNSRSTHIAICAIGSLYQYGQREGIFRSFMENQPAPSQVDAPPSPTSGAQLPPPPPPPVVDPVVRNMDHTHIPQQFLLARDLAMQTLRTFLSCSIDNAKVLHVQAWLVFLDFFIRHRKGVMLHFLEADVPWQELIDYINILVKLLDIQLDPSGNLEFPEIQGASATADDYALRALVWASEFHPKGYFANHAPESDRSYEHPMGTAGATANARLRKERVVYLAGKICLSGGYFKYDRASQQFELDSSLQERIATHAVKAASSDTPMTPATPQSDSASFSDSEYDNGAFEFQQDSRETGNVTSYDSNDLQSAPDHIKALLQQQRELASRLSQLKSNERESDSRPVVSEAGPAKATTEIRRNYTQVVVDTNLLLANLRMFDHILKSGDWTVVVPNPVVIELLGISRNEDISVGNQAKQALVAINEAATNNNPHLKIITSRGNRIQQPGFYRENISNYKAGLEGGIDDVIISITAGLSQNQGDSQQNGGPVAAVLLTNDNNMRLMAKAHGVHAISADDWSKQFGPRVEKRAEKRKLAGTQSNISPRSPRRKSSENASYTVHRPAHEG